MENRRCLVKRKRGGRWGEAAKFFTKLRKFFTNFRPTFSPLSAGSGSPRIDRFLALNGFYSAGAPCRRPSAPEEGLAPPIRYRAPKRPSRLIHLARAAAPRQTACGASRLGALRRWP